MFGEVGLTMASFAQEVDFQVGALPAWIRRGGRDQKKMPR